MEENSNINQTSPAAPMPPTQMSGEGTITGPGNVGKNKTPFFIAGFIGLMLLTGGALYLQNQSTPTTPTPSPVKTNNKPMTMETFYKEQSENNITVENAADVIAQNQAELQYNLDQDSVNNSVLDMFAEALN